MIKLDTVTTAHPSKLASYASSYSMAENNFSNSTQISESDHSDRESSNEEHDQSRPKKVRLPSISSIASSLRQPLNFSNGNSPSLPNLTYSQRAHSNPELNKLHVAAEIFTKNYNINSNTTSNDHTTSSNASQSSNGKTGSHTSSPMVQQQQVVYYPQQHPFPPQYHQLPPPQQSIPAPFTNSQPFVPLPPPQQHPSYYFPEPASHYTTTTQHHLSHHHQIKPKRNYTRRLSKIQQENKLKPQLFCQRCGITETPEWRKGPNGARTLCNACGLFHAKILKRDGPEAAANAINSNKIIKKNTFKTRRSSVNDAYQLAQQQQQQQHQHQQQQAGFQPPQQVQILPPPVQQLIHRQQGQQQGQPMVMAQPSFITNAPPTHPHQHHPLPVQVHVHQQHTPIHHFQQGAVLSPISPSSMHRGENRENSH